MKKLHMRIGTNYMKSIWKVDESLMLEFQIRLSYDVWENVSHTHNNKVVKGIFNAFLNTYIQIFYSCFPKKNIIENSNKKSCITTEMRISRKNGGGGGAPWFV